MPEQRFKHESKSVSLSITNQDSCQRLGNCCTGGESPSRCTIDCALLYMCDGKISLLVRIISGPRNYNLVPSYALCLTHCWAKKHSCTHFYFVPSVEFLFGKMLCKENSNSQFGIAMTHDTTKQ